MPIAKKTPAAAKKNRRPAAASGTWSPFENIYPVQYQKFDLPFEFFKNDWQQEYIWLHDAINALGSERKNAAGEQWDKREIYAFNPVRDIPDRYKENATAERCPEEFVYFTNIGEMLAANKSLQPVIRDISMALYTEKIAAFYIDNGLHEIPADVWMTEYRTCIFSNGRYSPQCYARHDGKSAGAALWPRSNIDSFRNDEDFKKKYEPEFPVALSRKLFEESCIKSVRRTRIAPTSTATEFLVSLIQQGASKNSVILAAEKKGISKRQALLLWKFNATDDQKRPGPKRQPTGVNRSG